MVLTKLHPIEDDAVQEEIDEILANNDCAVEAACAFVALTEHMDTEVSYSGSDMGGQYKTYTCEDGGLRYRLSCGVNVERPESGVRCEITVSEKF